MLQSPKEIRPRLFQPDQQHILLSKRKAKRLRRRIIPIKHGSISKKTGTTFTRKIATRVLDPFSTITLTTNETV